MTEEKLDPIHPGEVLLEEFLKPMSLSQNKLAISIGVPARRINEIVLGKRGITADTALRLGDVLICQPNSGWGYRWTMSLMSLRINWLIDCSKKFGHML